MNTTHSALQIIYRYNISNKINEMEKNKTNGTVSYDFDFQKENQIVAITCVTLSLIACISTLCAYFMSRRGQLKTEEPSRNEVWESTLMWIFANFVFSIIFRDSMILALLVLPSSVTNNSISRSTDTDASDCIFLAFYVYSVLTSYFWMFVQSLFLYLTYCHYDGLYNKVMDFTHKKLKTFFMCWLTPALLVIIWVTIHKVDDTDHLDLTFKNVPGWTCIIGPIYLLLGIAFLMMISVVYSYSWAHCIKLKTKHRKKLACKVCQRLNCRGTRQEIDGGKTDTKTTSKSRSPSPHIYVGEDQSGTCSPNIGEDEAKPCYPDVGVDQAGTCNADTWVDQAGPSPDIGKDQEGHCTQDVPNADNVEKRPDALRMHAATTNKLNITYAQNTTSYVSKIDGPMATCKTNGNTFNPHAPVNPKVNQNGSCMHTPTTKKQNNCICNFYVQLLCLELVWITIGLIILSAIFGLTTVISILIALIKKDDRHLQSIVGIVNGTFSFSRGFILATIFAWTDRKIRLFAQKGLSQSEAKKRASLNEFTSSRKKSLRTSHSTPGRSSFKAIRSNTLTSDQLAAIDTLQQPSLNRVSQSSNSSGYSSANETDRSASIKSTVSTNNSLTLFADIHEEPLASASLLDIAEVYPTQRSISLPLLPKLSDISEDLEDQEIVTDLSENRLAFPRKSSGYGSMGGESRHGSLHDTSFHPHSRLADIPEDLEKNHNIVTDPLLVCETSV